MQEACEHRSNGLVFLKVHPVYDPVRSNPVYQELVRKIGLPWRPKRKSHVF